MRYQTSMGKTHLCHSAGAEMKLLGGGWHMDMLYIERELIFLHVHQHPSSPTGILHLEFMDSITSCNGLKGSLKCPRKICKGLHVCACEHFLEMMIHSLHQIPQRPRTPQLRKLRTTEIHGVSIKQINCLCVLARATLQ